MANKVTNIWMAK